MRWAWLQAGVDSYESLWSIVHKFAQLNCAHEAEVRVAVGSGAWSPNSAFIEYGGIDKHKLRTALGLSRRVTEYAVIKPYLCRLFPTPVAFKIARESDEFAGELRYCAQCLSAGFHTPLFQLRPVHQCPVHRRRLTSACPSCRRPIPYTLTPGSLRTPYGCACGYTFYRHRAGREREHSHAPVEAFARWYLAFTRKVARAHKAAFELPVGSAAMAWWDQCQDYLHAQVLSPQEPDQHWMLNPDRRPEHRVSKIAPSESIALDGARARSLNEYGAEIARLGRLLEILPAIERAARRRVVARILLRYRRDHPACLRFDRVRGYAGSEWGCPVASALNEFRRTLWLASAREPRKHEPLSEKQLYLHMGSFSVLARILVRKRGRSDEDASRRVSAAIEKATEIVTETWGHEAFELALGAVLENRLPQWPHLGRRLYHEGSLHWLLVDEGGAIDLHAWSLPQVPRSILPCQRCDDEHPSDVEELRC